MKCLYRHRKTWLFMAICGLLLAHCTLQETPQMPQKSTESYLWCSKRELAPFIEWVREKEVTNPFIESMVIRIGKPMWDYADIEHIGGDTFIFVPLHHHRYGRSIHAIWFFYRNKDGDIYQSIRKKTDEDVILYDQAWLCEYFSYKVFGKENAEHVMFQPARQSRAWVEVETCWDAYIGAGENTPVEDYAYKGRRCKSRTFWVEISSITEPDEYGGGSGGSPNPSDGGGGGWNPPTETPAKIPTQLKKLIKSNNNLTDEDMKKLEKAWEKLQEDCFSKSFLKHLEDKKFAVNEVRILDEKMGNSSYSKKGYLSFQNDEFITPEILFHELFHLYQYKTHKDKINSSQIGWMEYERAIFADICNYIKTAQIIYEEKKVEDTQADSIKTSIKNRFWRYKDDNSLITDYASEEQRDDYFVWLDSITKQGFTYPTSHLTDNEIKHFLELYKVSLPHYIRIYTYDAKFSFHSIRNIMKVLSTKCNQNKTL